MDKELEKLLFSLKFEKDHRYLYDDFYINDNLVCFLSSKQYYYGSDPSKQYMYDFITPFPKVMINYIKNRYKQELRSIKINNLLNG